MVNYGNWHLSVSLVLGIEVHKEKALLKYLRCRFLARKGWLLYIGRKYMGKQVETNSLRAWVLAARPKTLAGAAVPVMIGVAYGWRATGGEDFSYIAALLCFLFAFAMQIDANFVNDYFDCIRGRDDDRRLGPLRACQQGWVTLKAMRAAIVIVSVAACVIGMPLVLFGGWQLIGIGLLCLVFCFLYTTMLAGKGLGDVLVVAFFGLVPCCFSYYVSVPECLQTFDSTVLVLSLACGMVVDTLLIVNNYRDIDNDRAVGKHTLVVALGRPLTEVIYLLLVPVALCMVSACFGLYAALFAIPTFVMHLYTWHTMRKIGKGRELNLVLGMTARNILIFGIMTTIVVIMA